MKTETAKQRPSHFAFVVEGEGKDSKWTEIGAVWSHEDGKGFNLNLKAIPLSGKVVLRTRKDEKEGRR